MADFTAEQKLEAIERELKLRLSVYERRVFLRKMTAEKADYEIAIMGAIAEDYRKLAEKERLL